MSGTLGVFLDGDIRGSLSSSAMPDGAYWLQGSNGDRDSGAEGSQETSTEVAEPPRFRVLMHNDDYTTMDFVVRVLETVFFKSPSEATQIMLAIHRSGVGNCGVFARDIAESKIDKVHRLAKKSGFPLKCSMEEA